MISIQDDLEIVSKELLEPLKAPDRGSPTRRVIDMHGNKDFGITLELGYDEDLGTTLELDYEHHCLNDSLVHFLVYTL